MANGNPLANIGRANDPTLPQRTVAASTAASALPGIGLKQILTNQGGLQRQGLANVGSMRNKIIGLGYDPDDPDVMRKIGAIGTSNELLADLKNMETGAKIGARIPDVRLGETLPIWARRGVGGLPGGQIGLGPPLGALATAAGTQTGTISETVKGQRPTAPGSLAQSEPFTRVETEALKRPLTAPQYRLPGAKPRQAAPPPKAATKKQAKQADRVYGTVGGRTGWWVKNTTTGKYNLEE
jgi:hypothetical protein